MTSPKAVATIWERDDDGPNQGGSMDGTMGMIRFRIYFKGKEGRIC